jgi:hypothetical protein
MAENQCDGCRSGMPLIKGVHWENGHPAIGCTKDLYEDKGDEGNEDAACGEGCGQEPMGCAGCVWPLG